MNYAKHLDDKIAGSRNNENLHNQSRQTQEKMQRSDNLMLKSINAKLALFSAFDEKK